MFKIHRHNLLFIQVVCEMCMVDFYPTEAIKSFARIYLTHRNIGIPQAIASILNIPQLVNDHTLFHAGYCIACIIQIMAWLCKNNQRIRNN